VTVGEEEEAGVHGGGWLQPPRRERGLPDHTDPPVKGDCGHKGPSGRPDKTSMTFDPASVVVLPARLVTKVI